MWLRQPLNSSTATRGRAKINACASRAAMTARLLAHAKRTSVTAVSTTTPALRCYSPPTTSRAAPPVYSRVYTGAPFSPEKVRCVCEGNSHSGKPLVECLQCGLWSHVQCARLTQRTAKRSQFICHHCSRGQKARKNNTNKGLIVRIPLQSSNSTTPSRVQWQEPLQYVLSAHPSPQTAIEIEEPTVNNADSPSPSNSSPIQQPTPVQTALHCQNQPSPPCVGTISYTCAPPSPPGGIHQYQSQPLYSTISWPAVPAATVTDSSESFSPVGIQGNMVAASHESCVSNNTPSCSIRSDTTCLVSSNNTPIVHSHSSNQSSMNPSARPFIPLPQTLAATSTPSNPNARISQQQSQSLRSILLQPLVPPTATSNHSAMGLSGNSSDTSRGLHVASNAPSGSNLPAVNVQSNTTDCSTIYPTTTAVPFIPPPQQYHLSHHHGNTIYPTTTAIPFIPPPQQYHLSHHHSNLLPAP